MGGVFGKQGKKTFVSKRRKHIEFKPGLYFIYTIPYGIYYVIGAGLGYSRPPHSNLCLYLSGGLGILLTLLGIGHAIEWYRGIDIEAFYILLPFLISMVVAILMTCFWALGGDFVPSGFVGIVGWVSFVFYLFAAIKDIGMKEMYPERYEKKQNYRYTTDRNSDGAKSNLL
jgi:hypothetical protein